jgi:GT2 family glycosyltransferase
MNSSSKTALTIAIPTRNRPHMLDGCLSALEEAVDPDDRIIVVDSASGSNATREVAARHGVEYLRCDVRGVSRARNAGWRAAATEIVAFVDDDVRVLPGWADAIRSAFEQYPNVTFVTGRIGLRTEQIGATRPVALIDEDLPAMSSVGLLDYLGHGASLAVRRSALEMIGGFDERLGAGAPFRAAEDSDLYDRLQSMGGLGRYEPAAQAWHEQWRSRKQLIMLDFAYGFGAGARIAKILRTDLAKGARAVKSLFWHWGVVDIVRTWKNGQYWLVLVPPARILGLTLGLGRALPVPMEHGHFRDVRRKERRH